MITRWLLPSLILICPVAFAQDAAAPTRAELAAKLRERGLIIEATDIRDSVIEGVYEIRLGATVGYISEEGRYLFEGNIFDLSESRNLTEDARSEARIDLLAGADPAGMIVFSPEGRPVEHTVTIFTDIDCGYCRQFHREIAAVNERGIEVRYLFYPRTGPDTESWSKAERVWCAENKNAALTTAKLGGPIPETGCTDNPVADQYDLGMRVGVTGTPSVYTASGVHIGGYLNPDDLLTTLTLLGD